MAVTTVYSNNADTQREEMGKIWNTAQAERRSASSLGAAQSQNIPPFEIQYRCESHGAFFTYLEQMMRHLERKHPESFEPNPSPTSITAGCTLSSPPTIEIPILLLKCVEVLLWAANNCGMSISQVCKHTPIAEKFRYLGFASPGHLLNAIKFVFVSFFSR